ncbi:hypothetical protein, partial [Myxosarcina sp. GI1(2024)]
MIEIPRQQLDVRLKCKFHHILKARRLTQCHNLTRSEVNFLATLLLTVLKQKSSPNKAQTSF